VAPYFINESAIEKVKYLSFVYFWFRGTSDSHWSQFNEELHLIYQILGDKLHGSKMKKYLENSPSKLCFQIFLSASNCAKTISNVINRYTRQTSIHGLAALTPSYPAAKCLVTVTCKRKISMRLSKIWCTRFAQAFACVLLHVIDRQVCMSAPTIRASPHLRFVQMKLFPSHLHDILVRNKCSIHTYILYN